MLKTGPVYSDGKIPAGTAKLVADGVFVIYGATVDLVRNLGPVTSYCGASRLNR